VDLAVGQPLHRQCHMAVFRRRGNRVAALSLVSVFGGQTHIDVLTGAVAGPLGNIEGDAANPGGLIDQLDDLAELPVQSPEYRCSRHGSPYM
jgi:hypothetical protein